MGASEIKAGEAYIEIGGRDAKLEAALKSAGEKVQSFGIKFAALGAVMSAPVFEATRAYAEFGKTIGKLHAKTGLDANFLTGMQYATQTVGVSMSAMSTATKNMQKAISGSSKDAGEALEKLGVNSAELKSMSAEDRFLRLADAVSAVSDPGERAAAAMSVFGRAGMELLPVIENGSEELRRMTRENQLLGGSFSGDVLSRAKGMDEAFERMARSAYNLKIAIGDALYPMMKPIIDRIIDVTVAASDWIKQNPDLVQSFTKLAIEVAGAGVAITAIGAAWLVVIQPAFLALAAVVAIGAATLAVLDIVGATDTGFGDLFNSIEVDGTGVANWFAGFFIGLKIGWEDLSNSVTSFVDHMTNNLREGIGGWEALFYYFRSVVARVMSSVVDSLALAINKIVDAYNAVTKFSNLPTIKFHVENSGELKREADHFETLSHVTARNARKRFNDDELFSGSNDKQANAELESDRKRLNKLMLVAPGHEGHTGVDTEKLTNSLKKIIDGGFGWISDAAKKVLDSIPHIQFEAQSGKEKEDADGNKKEDDKDKHGPKVELQGTFNARVVDMIGAASVFDHQLLEARNANKYLANISNNTGKNQTAQGAAAGITVTVPDGSLPASMEASALPPRPPADFYSTMPNLPAMKPPKPPPGWDKEMPRDPAFLTELKAQTSSLQNIDRKMNGGSTYSGN